MKFDLSIIGFGVIGVECLYSLVSKINKKQKLTVAIIEKDIKNIPGGVAYSKNKSKFGFFNNPLRLSHPAFIKWVQRKENINKIITFIKLNPKYKLHQWLSKNENYLNKNKVPGEIYFPRMVYSFYLEDRIKEIFKIEKKKKIKFSFFQANLKKIIFKDKYLFLKTNFKFNSFNILQKKNLIHVSKSTKSTKNIETKKLIVGNGLLPPKKLDFSNNNNYIWDFYAEGGTNNLIKKIEKEKKNKKKINITFIGNKAGLLETMLYIKELISKKKYNISINVISKKFTTLNKANFSKNNKPYTFKFFTNSQINKIKNSDDILNLLKKEFKNAKIENYNKYDIWTKVLNEGVLKKIIQKLDTNERKKYNLHTFPKIRDITRFTYPDPISAKNFLQKKKKIKMIKGRALSLKNTKKNIVVHLDNQRTIKSDIVVNVSGPVNLEELNKESDFIKSIKEKVNKFDKRGFMPNKNFMLTNQIYTPGTIAYNFNPSRQTIIKAITNNSKKTVSEILKKISKN